jgi:hypothetical protein
MAERDSYIFYRSFFEAIDELPEQNQLPMYRAIAQFSLNFKEIDLQGIESIMFKLIKPQLEANNKRFINGTQAKRKQSTSKTEANKNVNVNKNVNKNENKEVFNFKKSLLALNIEKQIVEDYLKVRKTKSATNSETAFNSIKSQLEKSNLSANESIKIAVEKSWSGFKAEWINNLNNGTHQQNNQKDNGHQFTIIK